MMTQKGDLYINPFSALARVRLLFLKFVTVKYSLH